MFRIDIGEDRRFDVVATVQLDRRPSQNEPGFLPSLLDLPENREGIREWSRWQQSLEELCETAWA